MIRRMSLLALLLATIASGCGEDSSSTGSDDSGTSTPSSGGGTTAPTSTVRVQPSDVSYLGAFRLPDVGLRPQTFEYGGSALTFNPNGDPGGSGDGFPGSLYISGHDRLAYGELPNGGQITEIGIPAPVASKDVGSLATAPILQGFREVTGGLFASLDEIPRLGMLYSARGPLGAKIHITWGQHLQDERPTHALFDPNLSSPQPRGAWFIGSESIYSVNGYMLEIPQTWADANASGRFLGTGRFRDGGWSGMGPALFAYVPWDGSGNLPGNGSRLSYTTLLRYESSENTADVTYRSMARYQHPDEWEGAAWVTTASGKTAVVFVGTKGTGSKYWYGWVNPAGANVPCVEAEMRGQFTLCYQADGTPCPASDLNGCSGHNDYRGWWSTSFEAQMIFFDPGQLAQVAAGSAAPYAPQPYASLSLDAHLRLAAGGVDADLVGSGAQRRYRLGETAYDRANGRLYVLELFADGSKPIVHVFRVT